MLLVSLCQVFAERVGWGGVEHGRCFVVAMCVHMCECGAYPGPVTTALVMCGSPAYNVYTHCLVQSISSLFVGPS